jgi:hypothetical protein
MTGNLQLNQDEQELNLSSTDTGSLHLVPLSIQQEGDSWLVGSLELNRFYQMPEIGVQIIRLLQNEVPLAEVKTHLGGGDASDIDVDEFASTLIELGLAYKGPLCKPVASSAGSSKWLRVARRIGRIVFSWPLACLYTLAVFYAASCLVRVPQARPSLSVFYFPGYLTASLLLLLVLRLLMVLLHELGHMLAAARSGIDSHLGVGTRLWTIVIEADLTGVLSLPRGRRYLPLLAGMLTDVLGLSVLVIAVVHLLNARANWFVIQLVQALIMQTLLFMLWQWNIFLRTDLYYVMCTMLAYPDLDRDARLYLQTFLYRLTGGHFGMEPQADQKSGRLNVVRAFSLIWLVGRLASFYLLVVMAVPTLWHYARDDYRAFANASWKAVPYDFLFFTLISTALVVSGLWMWLSQMKSRKLRLLNQQ